MACTHVKNSRCRNKKGPIAQSGSTNTFEYLVVVASDLEHGGGEMKMQVEVGRHLACIKLRPNDA